MKIDPKCNLLDGRLPLSSVANWRKKRRELLMAGSRFFV
jgi:hypothetical protein